MLASEFMAMGATPQQIVDLPDQPEFWMTPVSETATIGDLVKLQAENALKQLLAIAAYCKEHNLELSRETRNNIDESIKNLINSDKYRRSKAAFNSVLIRFNVDDAILREIRMLEELTGVFARNAFPDGGSEVTEEMIDYFYQETCSRVKHILIRYGPDGTIDAAVQAKIDEIYIRAANGEEFDSMLSESADGMPFDGYTVRADTPFVPEFLHAAFDMEIGEMRNVETSHGVHIMKRYELLPPDQAMNLNTGESWAAVVTQELQRELLTMDMAKVLEPYLEKIEINREQTDLFNTMTSTIMFDVPELWWN